MGFSKFITLITLLSLNTAFSAPIDWTGKFGLESALVNDFRRTNDSCTAATGSQCISEGADTARLQSMTIRLNPNMIINDGVTLKGELSTGSTSGNTRSTNLGDSTSWNQGAYFAQSASSSLNVNQFYAELYADAALFKVGRFAKHFGLGAVINNGAKTTDKFFSGYEGIEGELKLGNIHITPMWSKLDTDNSGTFGKSNGTASAYETSLTFLYDNSNKNMKFGMYWGTRESEPDSNLNSVDGTASSQNVTIMDFFFEKSWGDFKIAMELPMLSGSVSKAYSTTSSDLDTRAVLLETVYALNSKWEIGLNAGVINGDDGTSDAFEGMYLHPNYQLGFVMFKYNYEGFNSATVNAYNSSIVNTTYAQLTAKYSVDEWTWRFAALIAKANETAKTGDKFYDYTTHAKTSMVADQSDDMGYELDVAFDYLWNPAVTVTGFMGYHAVGDFYAFKNNASEELETTNVMATGMNLSVSF